MANILDFSVNTLTPTGTDKILTVSEDSYGHETLDSIKTYAQGDLPTRLSTAEGKVTTLEADVAKKADTTDVESLLTGYMKFPIVADAGFHNSIYRGKDISSYWNDGTIHSRIQGTNGYALFEDLFVGDYFTTGSATINGTTKTWYWVIAGFDLRLGVGSSNVTSHHAVLLPCTSSGQGADIICSSAMYDSVPFTQAYYGSKAYALMVSGGAIATGLQSIFGSNLLTSSELICTANSTSETGTSWGWQTVYAVLPSEVETYGSNVWGPAGYDGGMDSRGQLPLFRLKPSMISTRSYALWLRSLGGSASWFALVNRDGNATYSTATYSNGIRPRFLIK